MNFIEFITEGILKEYIPNLIEDCGIICFFIVNPLSKTGHIEALIINTFYVYLRVLFPIFLIGSIYFWFQIKQEKNQEKINKL